METVCLGLLGRATAFASTRMDDMHELGDMRIPKRFSILSPIFKVLDAPGRNIVNLWTVAEGLACLFDRRCRLTSSSSGSRPGPAYSLPTG